MQIHLAKPGGQKEGPYSLEQINQYLGAGIFRDTDYWAWHEGLTEWIPLHRLLRSLAGPLSSAPVAATPEPQSAAASTEREVSSAPLSDVGIQTSHAPLATVSHHEEPIVALHSSSTQISEAALSSDFSVAAPGLGDRSVAAIFSRGSAVVAEPDPVSANPNHTPVPDCNSNHVNPKGSFAAESDVVTALVQAIAEPEPAPTANGRTARFQPVANPEEARQNQTPVSVDQSAPSVMDHASRIMPEAAPPTERRGPSGLPCAALERIVIFSTGERQSLWASATAVQMLRDTIGEDPDVIRQTIPRDLIFNCDAASLFGFEGALSDSVWQAVAARHPALVQKQRQGESQVCVRSFRLEFGAVVVLVLFYDNARLAAQCDLRN